jgi:hypothetical protein
MKRFLLFAASAWSLLAGLLLVAVAQAPRVEPATLASHFHSGARRLVVVSADPADLAPPDIERGHIVSTLLLTGELPAGLSEAMVLTDLNCQADEQGISHCTNDVQIGDQQLALRHSHDMRQVPCLTPGEVVDLVSLADYRAQP